jgi:hypothetical protein
MHEINLTKNFKQIFDALQRMNMNITGIAKSMGYTTSSQLHSVLNGESMLSTKAIISLIQNGNVNPTFLFLGKGEMFLTDESEVQRLRKESSEWERKFFAIQDELFKSQAQLEQAVLRYNRLIDITSIAMEKTQKKEENGDKPDKK